MILYDPLQRTFRYHLGTLAFGSLIIAIIRMIRLVIEYIEQKLREKNQDNKIVKVKLFSIFLSSEVRTC